MKTVHQNAGQKLRWLKLCFVVASFASFFASAGAAEKKKQNTHVHEINLFALNSFGRRRCDGMG